jgi:hypothetical protein
MNSFPELARAVAAVRDHRLAYLVLAGVCVVVALTYLRRALAPMGVVVQAIAAGAVAVLAVGIAVVLLALAAIGGL